MKRAFLIHLFLTAFMAANGGFSVRNMKVEYTSNPIGIDIKNPRFSWQMTPGDNTRGYMQSAYQLIVKSPDGKTLWDTGKIQGNKSAAIVYTGSALEPATRYTWTVTVWDQSGRQAADTSWFETGLMNPDNGLSAWEGAQWIGGGPEDLVFQSHYLSVFKMSYSMQLDKNSGSTKAAFVLGANDSRLLDADKNIWGIASKRNGSYIKFELEVSPGGNSPAKLNIFRVGYHPDDVAGKPFLSINIPEKILNGDNAYEPHTFFLDNVFGAFTVFIDSRDTDHKLPGNINLNPAGRGGDYIAFPILADIGFSVDAGQKAFFSDLTVNHYREPSNTIFSETPGLKGYNGIFAAHLKNTNSGLSLKEGKFVVEGRTAGIFIVADPSRNSMPMLRTEFTTPGKTVRSARLYITSRGIYEVFINGKRVGEDYFNPGLTQYNLTHLYQTYDVAGLIIPGGKNAIGALLGEGWWSGNITYTGSNWNFFGDRQSLLAKLVITWNDGSRSVIVTNDRDWKYFNDGPVLYGSFFQGEFYDATKEAKILNWNSAGYNDSSWKRAVEVPLKGTTYYGAFTDRSGTRSAFSFDNMSLTGQIGENARIVKELTAISVKEIRPGVFIYDMGQNMVGVPQVKISGTKPGKKITLRYAEMLYPDLAESAGKVGMIMTENLRAAHVQDVYIAKGNSEVIQPRFTFHGYRYIEVSGLDKALPVESVKGLVISSVHETVSSYETSDSKVNRLWQNIVWSTLGNFLSIPTDCPQRNERMGWSGDISVFSRTATYMSNADQFMRRHMIAMRDLQTPEGKFTDVAPLGGGFGGILWGSAGITIPWEVYQQYGDIGLLEEHYEAMTKYIDYLVTRINKQTGLCTDAQLGDWLGPQNNLTGSDILATAYHIFDLDIMIKVADVLGKKQDAARFRAMYEERKELFNRTFVNADKKTVQGANGKLTDSQSSYAVGLALGAFSDANKPYMVKNLAAAVARENQDDDGVTRPGYSLMTGFIGTAWISKALSDNNMSELAYRLLQNNLYPSWLYAVDQGATSIWERLNGYTVENGFGGNNSMNSFNHYSFGAVGQWMMAYSLGIQRKEPGFSEFILQPEPDPTRKMTWARGYYDSIYGRINSGWKVQNNILTYNMTIPANTTAILYLPSRSVNTIRESGKKFSRVKGVTFVKYENGLAIFKVVSGNYIFTSEL
jgi:alpha-L-rhamnosidase